MQLLNDIFLFYTIIIFIPCNFFLFKICVRIVCISILWQCVPVQMRTRANTQTVCHLFFFLWWPVIFYYGANEPIKLMTFIRDSWCTMHECGFVWMNRLWFHYNLLDTIYSAIKNNKWTLLKIISCAVVQLCSCVYYKYNKHSTYNSIVIKVVHLFVCMFSLHNPIPKEWKNKLQQ